MSTANANNIIRLKGRLVKNPTNLSTAFPHGGTALGMVREGVFRFGYKSKDITAWEWGNQVVDTLYCGDSAIMSFVIRDYDGDMLDATIPNVSSSTIIGVASGSGLKRAGTLLSVEAITLLYSPDAVDDHPHILIYKALPMLQETAELQTSLKHEIGIAAMVKAIPDSQKRTYVIGKRNKISL